MKKIANALILILILPVLLFTAQVGAQSATSAPLTNELIAENCSRAQTRLKNINKALDRRARVDRLQAYNYIYQRFDAFAKRLENNKQPRAKEMRAALLKLSVLTEEFKKNYESYDSARESVATMSNCSQDVATFKERLENARQLRRAVQANVTGIQVIIRVDLNQELKEIDKALTPKQNGASDE